MMSELLEIGATMLGRKWYNESVEGVGRFSFCHYRAATYLLPACRRRGAWIGNGFMIRENEMEIDDRLVGKFLLDVNTGCWEWAGSKLKNSYGRMLVDGKNILVHRYSWEARNGKIPKEMYACHKCDNPCCINPDHLFIGTHEDNMLDMVKKKRGAVGQLIKLTIPKIAEIREYWTDHPAAKYRDVAIAVGCAPSTAMKYKPLEVTK